MNQTKTVRVNHDEFGNEVVETVETQSYTLNRVIQAVQLVASVLSILVLIRFFLILFGATRTRLVEFIYQITQPFVEPFYGLFGQTFSTEVGRIEIESLLAILAIAFIAFVMIELVRLLR